MGITFGGIPLTPPTSASDAAGTYWPGHRIQEWDFPGYSVPLIQQLPIPFWPVREAPRAGVLHWPTGADKFAHCHLIISGTQLVLLREVLGTSPVAQPLIFDDGTNPPVQALMYFIAATPISQRGDGYELYLLTLADERYFWWQAGAATTPVSSVSWTDFLTQLFGMIGVSPIIDSIPIAYQSPNNDRWDLGVQPIPMVIEAACRQIGMRVVRSLAGVVWVQRYETAGPIDELRWETFYQLALAGGQYAVSDIAASLPESATVNFFNGDVVTVTFASLGFTTGGVTGVPGWSARITSDLADPDTGDADAWAIQAADDYYSWAFSLTAATLRGFQNVPICGLDGAVEWVHVPDQMVTRILRPVWFDRNIYGEETPEGSGSGGSGGDCNCEAAGCDDPVDPVEVSGCTGGGGSGSGSGSGCQSNPGQRTLTINSLGIVKDGDTFQLEVCDTTEVPLGPCSPNNPCGTTIPAVGQVCPIYGFIKTVTSDYQITFADDIIFINGDSVVVTLPPASGGSGPGADQFVIKNIGSSPATVSGGGADIDGAATINLNQWEVVVLVTNTVDWFII